ncbi:MAG: hypothetical protein AMXMBFR77_09900 [Phycisphaerales bacterium]|nr:MAG: hypothetical protein BroJett004_03650 [Planctomycetota bacterium]
MVEKDAAHGLCGRGEEMGLIRPRLLTTLRQPQEGLMDKGGGLQSVAGPLGRHCTLSDGSKLGIDGVEEFG